MLKHSEVCKLLEHYFRKVVELKVGEGEGRRVLQEMEVRLAEEAESKRKAESVLGQVRLEGEKALVAHQMVCLIRNLPNQDLSIQWNLPNQDLSIQWNLPNQDLSIQWNLPNQDLSSSIQWNLPNQDLSIQWNRPNQDTLNIEVLVREVPLNMAGPLYSVEPP